MDSNQHSIGIQLYNVLKSWRLIGISGHDDCEDDFVATDSSMKLEFPTEPCLSYCIYSPWQSINIYHSSIRCIHDWIFGIHTTLIRSLLSAEKKSAITSKKMLTLKSHWYVPSLYMCPLSVHVSYTHVKWTLEHLIQCHIKCWSHHHVIRRYMSINDYDTCEVRTDACFKLKDLDLQLYISKHAS